MGVGNERNATDGGGATGEEFYEVIANRRRRFAVHALKRQGRPMDLGGLADQIAAWETDTSTDRVPSSARKSVYTSLQQVHLPKMDDADVVEFDKDRGTVDPTPKLEEYDVYIEFVEGREIPWHQYYVGLSVTGVVLVAALWLGVWPLTALSNLEWVGVVVAAVALSAFAHFYYQRRMRLGGDDEPPETRSGTRGADRLRSVKERF